MHAFDMQTDGRTEFSSLSRVCIACSAVKTINTFLPPPFGSLQQRPAVRNVNAVAKDYSLTQQNNSHSVR